MTVIFRFRINPFPKSWIDPTLDKIDIEWVEWEGYPIE